MMRRAKEWLRSRVAASWRGATRSTADHDAARVCCDENAGARIVFELGRFARDSFLPREFCDDRVFFVFGAARSGTSATIRILGQGTNVCCYEQKRPRLIADVRKSQLGLIEDVEARVLRARWPDMLKTISEGKLYGEKDQQVHPWLTKYWQMFGGRYIHVIRDGRLVVRSLMDFFYNVNGVFYREAGGLADLDEHISASAAQVLSVEEARTLERYRPRPVLGDIEFFRWNEMTRLEMAAYYWTVTTRAAERALVHIPEHRYRRIDFSRSPAVEEFRALYEFLGIEGFDAGLVARMLEGRPNSIESKMGGKRPRYPTWEDWTEEDRKGFDRYAGAAMTELGFYPIERYPFRTTKAENAEAGLHFWERDGVCRVLADVYQSPEMKARLARGRHLLLAPGAAEHVKLKDALASGAAIDLRCLPRMGLLPKGRWHAVHVLGLLEATEDIERTLMQVAALADEELVLVNVLAPFSDALSHEYIRRHEMPPANRVSRSIIFCLLRNALGFSSVKRFTCETGWVLNPCAEVVIGTRSQPGVVHRGPI